MKQYKLMNEFGQFYLSDTPGLYGGNKELKIYGELDCKSALQWIKKGYYVKNRVFFANEEIAIKAGYRPCGVCMREKYKLWNEKQKLTLKKTR